MNKTYDNNGIPSGEAYRFVSKGGNSIEVQSNLEESRANTEATVRVTPDDITNAVKESFYFTIGNVLKDVPYSSSLDLLTICVLVLQNDFTVIGKSACVDPKMFNEMIGQQLAREDAERQI